MVLQINNALVNFELAAALATNTGSEANAGNNDVAQSLVNSANQYLQDFNTKWAALGQQFGMQATATPEATSGS